MAAGRRAEGEAGARGKAIRPYNSSMALYSEPTSMMRSSMSMCVDAAPNASGRMAREKHAVKVEPPRPSDAMKSGTCLRCGCKTGTAHASPNECIDALREALAEVYSGEVRRIGWPPGRRRER